MIENAYEDEPDDQDLMDAHDRSMANRSRRRGTMGRMSGRGDVTCMDTDDDDLEFDNAEPEEYQDLVRKDLSTYMVSKANISKYNLDRTANHEQTGAPIVPNKILDSMMLRESEEFEKRETIPNFDLIEGIL